MLHVYRLHVWWQRSNEELWRAMVRNLVIMHPVNMMKQFPAITNAFCLTSCYICTPTAMELTFVLLSSPSNELPKFHLSYKFQNYVTVGWVHNEVLACMAVSKVGLQLCLIFNTHTVPCKLLLYLLFCYEAWSASDPVDSIQQSDFTV